MNFTLLSPHRCTNPIANITLKGIVHQVLVSQWIFSMNKAKHKSINFALLMEKFQYDTKTGEFIILQKGRSVLISVQRQGGIKRVRFIYTLE